MKPDMPNPESRRQARSHKDRKRWCGGKVGREHTYVIDYPPNYDAMYRSCYRPTVLGMPDAWMCMHVRLCTTCGRQEMLADRDLCPVYLAQES